MDSLPSMDVVEEFDLSKFDASLELLKEKMQATREAVDIEKGKREKLEQLVEEQSNKIEEQSNKIEELNNLVAYANFRIPNTSAGAFQLLQDALKCKAQFLIEQATNVLLDKLHIMNVLSVFKVASKNGLAELKDYSRGIIQENLELFLFSQLENIWKEDFLNIELEDMKLILSSDVLNVKDEDGVFKAVISWVDHKEGRMNHLLELIQCVRLENYNPSLLRALVNDRRLANNEELQSYVQSFITPAKDGARKKRPERIRRVERVGREVAFVLGGMESSGIVETLNATKTSWVVQRKISNAPSCYVLAVSLDMSILVIEPSPQKVRLYNASQQVWRTKASMKVPRFDASVTVLDGKVYLIGGALKEIVMGECEVYNLREDSWTAIASLKHSRRNSSSASLNGKIICCGGKLITGEVSACAEIFDPAAPEEWTLIKDMNVPRWRHCLLAYGGHVWALAGSNGKKINREVERYNPDTATWETMKPMSTARFAFAAFQLGEEIYVTGGYGETKQDMDSTEIFNPGTNTWSHGPQLRNARRWHAACVLKGLDNAGEYMADSPLM